MFEVIGDNGASARQWLELPTHCRQRAPSKADIQFECHERGRLIQAIGSLVASAMTYGDRCRRGARVRSCIDESTFTLAVHNDGDPHSRGVARQLVLLGAVSPLNTNKDAADAPVQVSYRLISSVSTGFIK